jgi:hypothetical protein
MNLKCSCTEPEESAWCREDRECLKFNSFKSSQRLQTLQ